MQPGAQRFWLANRPPLSGQYEEDSLGCILCLVSVAKDVEANAVDHRAVALDESGKSTLGGFIGTREEALQQLCIRARRYYPDSAKPKPLTVPTESLVPCA